LTFKQQDFFEAEQQNNLEMGSPLSVQMPCNRFKKATLQQA